jgi:GAF domain-containing protein
MTTHHNDETTAPEAWLPVLPNDGDKGPMRAYIQQQLGFIREVKDRYDDAAVRALRHLGGTMAGVNHLDADLNQFFVGFAVRDADGNAVPMPPSRDESTGEILETRPERAFGGRETGYCAVLTAERTMALPLNDVQQFHRFAHNPVTEVGEGKPGVRAYIAAPLLTTDDLVDSTGAALPADFVFGTLWVVDNKPQTWTTDDVAWLNGEASILRDAIVAPHRR